MEKEVKRKGKKKTLGKSKKSGSKKYSIDKNVLRKIQTSKLIRIDEMLQNDKLQAMKKGDTSASSYKSSRLCDMMTPKHNKIKNTQVESRNNLSNGEQGSLLSDDRKAEPDHEMVVRKRKLSIEKVPSENITPCKSKEITYKNTPRKTQYTMSKYNTSVSVNAPNYSSGKYRTYDETEKNGDYSEGVYATLQTYATIRNSLPRLKKKLSTDLATYRKSFKLKNKKSITTIKLENSMCYSTGDMSIVKKNSSSDFLSKKNKKKRKKISRNEEKKRTLSKGKEFKKTKGRLSTITVATSMKGNTQKLKKGKTVDFNRDKEGHSARILPNRHVHIADDIEILEVSASKKHAMSNGSGRRTNGSTIQSLLDKRKKELNEEGKLGKEETEEKERKLEKSMKSGWMYDQHEEREIMNKENRENEYLYNGPGEAKEAVEEEGEGGIYKSESEENSMEEYDESKEYIKEKTSAAKAETLTGKEGEVSDSSSDSNPEDIVEMNTKLEEQTKVDPLKAEADEILKKYIKYKIHINKKMNRTVNIEPIDIKEGSLKLGTIKFLSHIKESTYYDDILFLFDNYEEKKKKDEDLLRLFNKLFKCEYLELDRIQSILILFDRIQNKMKTVMKPFPLKSIFQEAANEMKKLCEEAELKKKEMKHKKLHEIATKLGGGTEQVYIKIDKDGNKVPVFTNLNTISEENKLVEVKIKKNKKHHYTNLRRIDNTYTNGTTHLQFIPYLLRRHWHNQNKLEVLRDVLNEMKRRKKPKYLHLSKAVAPNTKWCMFNLLCTCYSGVQNQKETNSCCCSFPLSQTAHGEYATNNYNQYDISGDASKAQSYKISDIIQAMSPN